MAAKCYFFPRGMQLFNKKREIRFPDTALHSFTCPTSSNFLEFELCVV